MSVLGHHRRLLQVYVVGAAFTVLAALIALLEPGFLKALETDLLDLHFTARGHVAGERQVAIVAIDDASLNRTGKWPWKRTLFADLIEILTRSGARVIAFDIFFQPDDRDTMAADTQVLAQAMSKAGNVILPIYFNLNREEASDLPGSNPNDLAFPLVKNTAFLDRIGMVNGYDLNVNEPLLEQAALGAGHINLVPDSDGTARHEVLALRHAGHYIPSFSLRVVQRFLAAKQDRLQLIGGQGVEVGDLSVAITSLPLGGARLWGAEIINWRGGYRSFPYFSASDVLAERFPANAFNNKIVLVGATAPGLYDAISTPLSSLFPGVEKNANAIANILDNDFIRRPEMTDLWSVILCVALGLVLTGTLPHLGLLAQGLVVLGAMGITAVGSQFLFTGQGVWLPLAAPLATTAMVSLAVILALFLKTREEHDEAVEERFETIVELGLSYQNKGLLEMAYQHFSKLPLTEESMRLLYNLALELQRKRKTDLACTIFKRLYAANRAYEDVASRLTEMGVEVVLPASGPEQQGTVTFLERAVDPEETSILKSGQTLGRYEIQRLLGRGSMGAVYLARDPTIDRSVAIKTFHLTRFAEADELAELKGTFLREAQLAGRLNHPNIVTIFDAGEDWDLSYIAMEVLKGVELRRYCQPGKLLPLAQVVTIIRTVTRALDYAHRHGVIHRDVKPANIMVVGRGQIKLTDFGIALVKGEMARLAGTPAYMAPEQLTEGAVVDGRTDLYALGVIFFELLSARKPFPATSFDMLRQSIMTTPAPRIGTVVPGLPSAVEAIISRLLAKRPDDRFADGRALDAALAKLARTAGPTQAKGATASDAGDEALVEDAEATVIVEQPPASASEGVVREGEAAGDSDEATVILDQASG